MVGTANLIYPDACIKVRDGIQQYMQRHQLHRVSELTGALKLNY